MYNLLKLNKKEFLKKTEPVTSNKIEPVNKTKQNKNKKTLNKQKVQDQKLSQVNSAKNLEN